MAVNTTPMKLNTSGGAAIHLFERFAVQQVDSGCSNGEEKECNILSAFTLRTFNRQA